MMGGGTVIFTYKRKRFSSKPHNHKIEELPPNVTCKPQVEDSLIKENPQIETQKSDEPKAEIHRTDQNMNPLFEIQNMELSQIELLNVNKPQSELQLKNELRSEIQIKKRFYLESDEPKPELHRTDQNMNPLFELQNMEQSQTELLNVNEPQIELQIENELRSEIQIKKRCYLESDNRDNPQNELHKIDEIQVEHQIRDQKADKMQCEEQERKDIIQLEPEKLGAEVESLNKSSETQIETKELDELDEMKFTYPVEERAEEESRNKKQKCEIDPQKSNELQSGDSIEHPVEDCMEIDDGEDIARTHASSKTLMDSDRGKHETTAELPNSDQTKNNVAPNEKTLICDESKQVRPIIDLTKPPLETELEIETQAFLPPENISQSWKDREVQLLESLDNKHRKTKDRVMKGEKLSFDLGLAAPELLPSLRPNLDQDVFYTHQNRARPNPKPSLAGTSRFGLPYFPTSTSKGKNVNSIATHDFFSNPGIRDPFEHMHKQVLENIYTGSRIMQDKLKYTSRINNTYNYKLHDWSEEELDCLWIGVRRYGVNNWDAVLHDPRFIFSKSKTVADLEARWEVERRRLFSCPLPVPESLPFSSRTSNWYSNLEAEQYWHSGMVPMPEMIPRRGSRPKYQIRRAPNKAQSVTRTPSPPISGTRNSGLPHWLKGVRDLPLGLTGGAGCAAKDLLNCASEPLIEPEFKLGKKGLERGNKNLVILDSDGASSEETLSA